MRSAVALADMSNTPLLKAHVPENRQNQDAMRRSHQPIMPYDIRKAARGGRTGNHRGLKIR